MTEDDARPELPGSSTPPVEGVRWVWIKLVAWGVAVGLILLIAYVAAVVIGGVSRRLGVGADQVVAALNETFETPRQEDLLEVRRVQIGASPAAPPKARADGEGEPDIDVDKPATWVRTPRPVFPVEGMRANIGSATVALECRALTSGRVGPCRVISEEPSGHGFAKAALAAMTDARLAPAEVDGEPVESPFRFMVRFRVD